MAAHAVMNCGNRRVEHWAGINKDSRKVEHLGLMHSYAQHSSSLLFAHQLNPIIGHAVRELSKHNFRYVTKVQILGEYFLFAP
jgi:hypothetical protein